MLSRLASPRTGGLAALALVVLLLPLALHNSYYYEVAILVGLNAIVCVGLNLLIGYAGQISLGHAGFFGLGAYASAILTARYGWPAIAAIPAAMNPDAAPIPSDHRGPQASATHPASGAPLGVPPMNTAL